MFTSKCFYATALALVMLFAAPGFAGQPELLPEAVPEALPEALPEAPAAEGLPELDSKGQNYSPVELPGALGPEDDLRLDQLYICDPDDPRCPPGCLCVVIRNQVNCFC